MKRAAAPEQELRVVLVGSKSSRKNEVGNIILGKEAFKQSEPLCRSQICRAQVHGRTVWLVKVPGWLRGYRLRDTPQLHKIQAALSADLCPPGPHAFVLAINTELRFKEVHRRATVEHLERFFGEDVWRLCVVVFKHRGRSSVEDYIRCEGAPIQALLDRCDRRYCVLMWDERENNEEQVLELFRTIDAMVAGNGGCHYEVNRALVQRAQEKKRGARQRAEERRRRTEGQRQMLQSLLTGDRPNLNILLLGWVFSGKSALGNSIMAAEVFQSAVRTVESVKNEGTVAGRRVTIVDTPGWWKFFPAKFIPSSVKEEILKGASLCSPSPNVILLAIPCDTSFTEEQRRVIEDNLSILGERVWRHVIVVFTFMDTMRGFAIERHIECEGAPLRWLIEKCGNRYYAVDNTNAAVGALWDIMEELVAGNSYFYISADKEMPDEEDKEDKEGKKEEEGEEDFAAETMYDTEFMDEGCEQIMEQLLIEWDRRCWDNPRQRRSMFEPPKFSGDVAVEGDIERILSGGFHGMSLTSMIVPMRLLEREWTRREMAVEFAFWCSPLSPSSTDTTFTTAEAAPPEEEGKKVFESRQQLLSWLRRQQGRMSTLGKKLNESLRKRKSPGAGAVVAHSDL